MTSNWITLVGVLLTAIGAIGVAYAVLRSTVATKTIEIYSLENEALGKSVARQNTELIVLQERVSVLEKENRVLRDVVTGRAAVEALTLAMQHEHAEIISLLKGRTIGAG